MTRSPGGDEPRPARRFRRRFLRGAGIAALSLCVALLLAELVLRVLLFSNVGWIARLGAPLRRPELYTSAVSATAYWKLCALFTHEKPSYLVPDARFGWIKEGIDRSTLRHADDTQLGERRPVLLYGDSFAACASAVTDCWQELLERSDLAPRFALLNYGVPGYGLDQELLLMRATLDLYAARKPVVVIGILVDEDLDRCSLGLREAPKPWFTVAPGNGSELVLHPVETLDASEYVRAHPPGIWSYVWRLALIRSGLVKPIHLPEWTGESEHLALKEALAPRLLDEIERELAGRGLEHFYLLFHGLQELRHRAPWLWQEPLLYRELAARHLPFVSSKRALLEYMARVGAAPQALFISSGPGLNHYNDAGNAVVFAALRAGLEGRFEPYEYLAGLANAADPRPEQR